MDCCCLCCLSINEREGEGEGVTGGEMCGIESGESEREGRERGGRETG